MDENGNIPTESQRERVTKKSTEMRQILKNYNPNMARRIARTKDVDPETRRKNNEAARVSRAKAKCNMYSLEEDMHQVNQDTIALKKELERVKLAYIQKRKGLMPKIKAKDPYLMVAESSNDVPALNLPLSAEGVKRKKVVVKFLSKLSVGYKPK